MNFDRYASAGYMTNWAARLFARAIDRELRGLGLASGQMPVFFALSEHAELSQKALAQAAAIEQPTMAATIARMERDGLLKRRPDPRDGRSALFSLTPAARKKADVVRQAISRVNGAALETMTETEREAFQSALRSVVTSLERFCDNGRSKAES